MPQSTRAISDQQPFDLEFGHEPVHRGYREPYQPRKLPQMQRRGIVSKRGENAHCPMDDGLSGLRVGQRLPFDDWWLPTGGAPPALSQDVVKVTVNLSRSYRQ